MLTVGSTYKETVATNDTPQAATPTLRSGLNRRNKFNKAVAYDKENQVEARRSSLEHAEVLAPSARLSTSKESQTEGRRGILEPAEHSANANELLDTKENALVWKRTQNKVLPSTVLRDKISEPMLMKNSSVKHKQTVASRSGLFKSRQRSTFEKIRVLFFGATVLLFIVTFLGTTIWNWKKPRELLLPSPPTFNHLSELQAITNTSTTWIQKQLELLDMKLNTEVEAVKKDMENKLRIQILKLETTLNNFRTRIDSMTSAVAKLTDEGILSRQDGADLIISAVNERASDNRDTNLSLDDLRAVARQIVRLELEKHAADGIGRVDYALASGGGKVIGHSEPYVHGRRMNLKSWLGFGFSHSHGSFQLHPMANKVLEPSFGEPGHCLPLRGDNVYVQILLRTAIFPEAVTLEHVSQRVAYDIKSAPKHFRVFGWLQKEVEQAAKILLGEFSYELQKENIQTFHVPKELTSQLVNAIMLHVLSNHGSPSHTCLYRVRVHGFEPLPVLSSIL